MMTDKELIAKQQQTIYTLSKYHNTAAWAKGQLRILGDMAEARGMDKWFVQELRRICDGIQVSEEEGLE